MPLPKLAVLELKIMEIYWERGLLSIREVQEDFPTRRRPAYTTVQTTVNRLARKGALRFVKQIGKANIYEPAISRQDAHGRLIDDLLALIGGGSMPVMARLVESGKLTINDVREAEELLRQHSNKKGGKA